MLVRVTAVLAVTAALAGVASCDHRRTFTYPPPPRDPAWAGWPAAPVPASIAFRPGSTFQPPGAGPGTGATAASQNTAMWLNVDGTSLEVVNAHGTSQWSLPPGAAGAVLRQAGQRGTGYSVFSPDGRELATTTSQGASVWNLASGTPVAIRIPKASLGSPGPAAVAFSPDGKWLAIVAAAQDLYLWDTATHVLHHAGFIGVTDDPHYIAFAPDGQTLAYGTSMGEDAWLANVARPSRVTSLRDRPEEDYPGSYNPVVGLAFGDGGRLLAVANLQYVALWDVAGRRLLARLHHPHDQPAAVAFSPDGSLLAATFSQGDTWVWEVATGQRVATLASPGFFADPGGVLAFSGNGKVLAISDPNGTVHTYHVG